MGTIVDAIVPADQFALGGTFERAPDVEFESVRVAAHRPDRVLPFVWASGADPDALADALEADATTTAVRHVDRVDARDLYQVRWRDDVRRTVCALVEEEGLLLSARGRSGWWEFRVLFPDRAAVSATYDGCRTSGLDLSVRRVQAVTGSFDRSENGLSAEQYEALTTAFETDYYGVPRGMTLVELAGELGVSHQALSERLRRGHQALISNALYDAPTPATGPS